jgi:clan AA aspartic protease
MQSFNFIKTPNMGMIHADIELVNVDDLALHRKHHIDQDEIKSMYVNVLVDTGSYMLAINENMQQILQLTVQKDKRRAQLANGESIWCDVVGPVEIRFQNRKTICTALVLPGDAEPLLGAIPMEDLDVRINPLRQELVVNPDSPDYAMTYLKKIA